MKDSPPSADTSPFSRANNSCKQIVEQIVEQHPVAVSLTPRQREVMPGRILVGPKGEPFPAMWLGLADS